MPNRVPVHVDDRPLVVTQHTRTFTMVVRQAPLEEAARNVTRDEPLGSRGACVSVVPASRRAAAGLAPSHARSTRSACVEGLFASRSGLALVHARSTRSACVKRAVRREPQRTGPSPMPDTQRLRQRAVRASNEWRAAIPGQRSLRLPTHQRVMRAPTQGRDRLGVTSHDLTQSHRPA